MTLVDLRRRTGGAKRSAECGRPRPQQRPNGDAALLSQTVEYSTLLRPGTGALRLTLAKNGLAAKAGGVTVEPAMKTLSAKPEIVDLPFVK